MPSTITTTEQTLAEKTMDYWDLQRAARGLESRVKTPTVELVLGMTTLGLKQLNPSRPLAKQLERLKWEAIDTGCKTKKGKVAATISYLPTKAIAQ